MHRRLIPSAILAFLLLAAVPQASAHGHVYVHGSFVIGPPAPAYAGYPVDDEGRPLGAIDLDVSPEETKVWIDGRFAGTCDDFDGFPSWLYLPAGSHQLRLQTPEGHVHSEKVRIRAGMKLNYDLKMGK
jgi:hypothetical protein